MRESPLFANRPRRQWLTVTALVLGMAFGHLMTVVLATESLIDPRVGPSVTLTISAGLLWLPIWPLAVQFATAAVRGRSLWTWPSFTRWAVLLVCAPAMFMGTLMVATMALLPCLVWVAGFGGLLVTLPTLVPMAWLSRRAFRGLS